MLNIFFPKGEVIILNLTDKRLLKCAELITGKGVVCDVGTDHAYLPVYLVENNYCKSAIAADIADGPLETAKTTVERYGLTDKIELRKSDGLKNINPDGITDVIIAGMGAETISSVLSAVEWIKNGVNIIIQPMTKVPFMRKWIYENGYEIVREEAVCDNDFVYTIMIIRYTGYRIDINELAVNLGKFDYKKEDSIRYARRRIKQISEIAEGIKKSGKDNPALKEKEELIFDMENVLSDNFEITVGTVLDEINRIAPFDTQDSWDNSGLIVGDRENVVSGVLVALDITNDVIDEAVSKNANLIISHHPVIFRPVKQLSMKNPAVKMVSHGISAICVHTPIDMAVGGINDIIVDMLSKSFKLKEEKYPLLPLEKGNHAGTGRIVELDCDKIKSDDFAQKLKEIFGCKVVRYTCREKEISKIAICSGSGGSLLDDVEKSGCDAYITGDIKHDVWIDASNNDIALFDCGHYYTEQIVVDYIVSVLKANIPGINTDVAVSGTDVVSYVF